jgi:putative glutamine amidotransferase
VTKVGVTSRMWPGRADARGSQREATLVLPLALQQSLDIAGATALLLPPRLRSEQIAACASSLDGLLLQGGSDISPLLYGEEPMRPQWQGDIECDKVEISLLQHFIDQRKPVLGVCRGCQLINVAFGGSLYQDLPSQMPQTQLHSDPARYVQLEHAVQFAHRGHLSMLYGTSGGLVNSAHHQAIRRLGRDLEIEATSVPDGLIEAFRWHGHGYVLGVQWHPEYADARSAASLPGAPLFADFVAAIRSRGQG